MMETVDVIYPEGPGGSNRIVVDVIHYRERRGSRAVSIVPITQISSRPTAAAVTPPTSPGPGY